MAVIAVVFTGGVPVSIQIVEVQTGVPVVALLACEVAVSICINFVGWYVAITVVVGPIAHFRGSRVESPIGVITVSRARAVEVSI